MVRVSRWTFGSVLVVGLALSLLTTSLAGAVDGAVSATVTPQVVGITVTTDGVIAFGKMPLGATVTAIDAETVENSGNWSWESLTASFSNTPAASGCGWTAGTPAEDVFAMNIDSNAVDIGDDGFDSAGTSIPASGSSSTIDNSDVVFPLGTLNLDFEIVMPTSVTSGTTECSIGITLTAS